MTPKNIGFIDQFVRGLIIVDLLIPCLLGMVAGPLFYRVIALSVSLVVTCLTGYCPLYNVFKITTRREWD